MKLKKYFKVWLKTTVLSFQVYLFSRGASLLYLLGKFFRFGFFIILLYLVFGKTSSLAGFSLSQFITFFLVFNLLDILGQLFFRGIYWFRGEVITGKFDLTLVKPVNPLFQILTGRTDFLDLPLLLVVIFLLIKINPVVSWLNLLLFGLILGCGFLLVIAIHILVASVGVLTTEVDHSMWIYRDLSFMVRVPVDIYQSSVRAFLTFILPLAVVFNFPAKALLGILSWQSVIYSIIISMVFLRLSLFIWSLALTKYSSASS